MDKETKGIYLEILKVLKFVIHTKNFGLQSRPEFQGRTGVSVHFAIVTGLGILKQGSMWPALFCIWMNVLVCWQAKAQKEATLSSSERNQVRALLTLQYQGQSYPIKVKIDNVAAILMAQNASYGVKTWYIDPQYCFVWKNLEAAIIKIEFSKSIKNESDIFTKNVTQEIYKKHGKMFLEVYIKGSTVAERLGIGRVLEMFLRFLWTSFSLLEISTTDTKKCQTRDAIMWWDL
jgi:hypothetical protein